MKSQGWLFAFILALLLAADIARQVIPTIGEAHPQRLYRQGQLVYLRATKEKAVILSMSHWDSKRHCWVYEVRLDHQLMPIFEIEMYADISPSRQ